MPCGWEGNRRSGVALAMRHRLQWFIHLRAHGLRKGDKHHAYAAHGVWHTLCSLSERSVVAIVSSAVCLSVCEHISETTVQSSSVSLYSRGSMLLCRLAIRYVLPVLWMKLCLHRGPIYKISYDLSQDYLKFIVRSSYDSDLKLAKISHRNIVR